ncbi:ATP-dependent Clp protease proteolytic subunit 2 [Acetobacteraceae bacterium EV16G]|uniref:ATP-dependent Clp protease proteolytic subunit n=2 Tax=Sorlinia euscelidii TaxID=3081148 RepID=A0ABU7U2U8_9PROT
MEGTMAGLTADREIGPVRMQSKSDFPSQFNVARLKGASSTSIRSADPEPAAPDSGNSEPAPAPGASNVENKLFEQRTVLIFGGIDDKIARETTARLLALAGESGKPIDVYVNSPGGHVESGDTIHDVIKFVDEKAPINMIGTGWVASAGALIFAAGHRNRRFCFPNTRFLLHQPAGGVRGPASDIDIEAKEILKMRERLNHLFAKVTGQEYKKILKDTDRNHWLSAEEAISYGLVTRVISQMSELSR